MKFSIDFNRESNDKLLEQFGAEFLYDEKETNGEYYIEIKDLKELEELSNKINNITKKLYSLIISFDPASIYLDKDI